MATTKNITMKQFNGTDYDTLYPKTKVEQVEGAYTQQQILANSTKTLYGLDATAVPDDVFNVLSRFQRGLGNEYVWEKSERELTAKANGTGSIYSNLVSGSSTQTTITLYSDYVLKDDGKIELTGDSVTLTGSYYNQPSISSYAGYYGYNMPDTVRSTVYKITDSSYAQQIYFSSNSTYGWNIANCTALKWNEQLTFVGYVNSPDPNAYPPSVSDGFKYIALGQVGSCAHIETGTYVGTGTNACSIQYERTPKFVAIFSKTTTNSSDNIPFAFFMPGLGSGVLTYPKSSEQAYCYVANCYLQDNAFKTSNSYMDISGRTYQYIMLS